MATRFYLPVGTSDAAFPTLPVASQWELVAGPTRRLMRTRKIGSTLTNGGFTWPSTGATVDLCAWQFQSEPIKSPVNLTTSHTARVVIRCGEATVNGNTALSALLRLADSDGNIRAVLNTSMQSGGTEFALSAAQETRIQGADVLLTNITANPGDRLIFELGGRGLNPALEAIQIRLGDPLTLGDFAFTSGLTTDLVPWFEISADIDFGETERRVYWVNSIAGGTDITLKPEQSVGDVNFTVAASQTVPVTSKRVGGGAVVVGLPL